MFFACILYISCSMFYSFISPEPLNGFTQLGYRKIRFGRSGVDISDIYFYIISDIKMAPSENIKFFLIVRYRYQIKILNTRKSIP